MSDIIQLLSIYRNVDAIKYKTVFIRTVCVLIGGHVIGVSICRYGLVGGVHCVVRDW